MLVMLDAGTVGALMRGHAGIDARLLALDPAHWCISAITHAQICADPELRDDESSAALTAQAFFEIATTSPWDAAAATAYGAVRAQLDSAGTSFGLFDAMAASHAVALGAVLVTSEGHKFRGIRGLLTEDWVGNSGMPVTTGR